MNAFIAQTLNKGNGPADTQTVNTARLLYLQRYGATLLGMIKHHAVRAEEFLHDTHQFDDLRSMIRAERGLARLLKRLPGRKILLTNGPQRYSREVMRHLGLHRYFAKHIAIESMHVHRQLRPKPSKLLLRKLMRQERIAPHRCILVEDTSKTLKAAKALGLRTAWVTRYLAVRSDVNANTQTSLAPKIAITTTKRPVYIDVKVKSVHHLFDNLRRLTGTSF